MHRVLLIAVLLLTACAGAPQRPAADAATGERIAATAMAQVGQPYRFGGSSPGSGFDCSGLVLHAHAAEGIAVPRTTEDQFRAARSVPYARLAPGDLLFFRFDGPKVSHVGIYTGGGRFVHAPQTGRPVETRGINDPGYRSQLVGAGRLY